MDYFQSLPPAPNKAQKEWEFFFVRDFSVQFFRFSFGYCLRFLCFCVRVSVYEFRLSSCNGFSGGAEQQTTRGSLVLLRSSLRIECPLAPSPIHLW